MTTENEKNVYDRRIKICFHTLNEQQEILLSCSLVDYMIWYKNNKEKVDSLLIENGEEININSMLGFWIDNVGKSEKIEELLNEPNVIIDAIKYIDDYFEKFTRIKNETDHQVFCKEAYRTESQAKKLNELFEKHPKNHKVKQVKEFLSRNKMDADHINKDFATRSINTCLKYI